MKIRAALFVLAPLVMLLGACGGTNPNQSNPDTPITVSAANSSITGTSPVAADGASTAIVTITLRDGGNNPIGGVTPTFSATDTGATNVYGACSPGSALGVSTCTLRSTHAEAKTLSIVTPVNKAGGTVTFTPVTRPVTGITLHATAFVALNLTTRIAAKVLPGNATNKTLNWVSSDPTVATISSSGIVTGLKVGTTNISARSTDGSNVTSNACFLTVTETPTHVTQIVLPLANTVYVGSTAQIPAIVSPATAINMTLSWTSSDSNVATVDGTGVVAGVRVGTVQITATSTDGTEVISNFCTLSVTFSPQSPGWTDFKQGLVVSDGTRSLGDNEAAFNSTRDQGSKIVYFNSSTGNNDTAEAYWWNGTNIIDSTGSATNGSGQAYGTDPLNPNEGAIRPFRQAIGMAGNAPGDPRLRAHMYSRPSDAAGGYADWFLLRRGQVHDTFDGNFNGGRNESHPVVVAGYGPQADGRAIIAPNEGLTITYRGHSRQTTNPFQMNTGDPAVWMNMVISGLELRAWWESAGFQDTDSLGGGPATLFVEDCAWIEHAKPLGATLLYLPKKTTLHRSIVAFAGWTGDGSHSLGYYTSGSNAQVTFDDVIFYKGGFQSDPLTTPDPKRDIFSRNIYEGGGAFMGHAYRNFISADGGSGGPQMRFGGLIENSLIIEGYWYSGTESNGEGADWVTEENRRSGSPSAIIRNNVQLVFAYPTPNDPDPMHISDSRSQPGWGFHSQAATFGAEMTGNIITDAMLQDDLGSTGGAYGINLAPSSLQYPDGNAYTMLNNNIAGNIFYRTSTGLQLESDWTGTEGNVIQDNVFAVGSVTGGSHVTGTTIDSSRVTGLSSPAQLTVRNNRFYAGSGATLPSAAWIGSGNTIASSTTAASSEGWSDPDRTLKRYVTEVLGLTLLDWNDDPYLSSTDPGTEYDQTGMKTFMATAVHMRRGGATPIPVTGKPSWTGDYPWDERFTAQSVVNWIRAGFGLEAVE